MRRTLEQPKISALETACALLLAAALLAAIYLPAFLREPAFVYGRSDLWGYFGPMAFYLDTCLAHGHWPQWNPHVLCGAPFVANPQAAVYYPPHLLRAIMHVAVEGTPSFHGTFISLALMVLAHQLLLAAGIFRFAREVGLCRMSSAAAMLAFLGASELAFRSVQHWAFVAEAAWLPWLLIHVHRALHSATWRAYGWNVCIAGMIFGVTVLIGFPQLTMYLAAFVAVYAVLVSFLTAETSGANLVQRCRDTVGRASLLVGMVVAIGAVLALPMLLPAAELAGHAQRAKGIGSAEDIADPRIAGTLGDAEGTLQIALLYPGAHGVRLLGAVAAFVALCALRSARWRHAAVWGLLLLAMLDACLGPPMPLASLVAWAAPFRVAEPQRAALFAAFALSMLVGYGIDALARPRATRLSSSTWAAVFLALSVGAALALVEWQYNDPVQAISPLVLGAQALGLACIIAALAVPRWRAQAIPLLVAMLAAETAAWGGANARFLVASDPLKANAAAFAKPVAWSTENARRASGAWRENDAIWTLDYAMTGYDPLMLSTTRQLLCAPRTETLYNRRIPASEVVGENTLGISLVNRLFWLADERPPIDAPSKFTPAHPGHAEKIEIVDAAPNALRVAIADQPTPRWLVFTESRYPGWRAKIDGVPAPLDAAYGAFQSVPLTPGPHVVEFAFSSPRVWAGAALGAIGWATVLAALWVLRARRFDLPEEQRLPCATGPR